MWAHLCSFNVLRREFAEEVILQKGPVTQARGLAAPHMSLARVE